MKTLLLFLLISTPPSGTDQLQPPPTVEQLEASERAELLEAAITGIRAGKTAGQRTAEADRIREAYRQLRIHFKRRG